MIILRSREPPQKREQDFNASGNSYEKKNSSSRQSGHSGKKKNCISTLSEHYDKKNLNNQRTKIERYEKNIIIFVYATLPHGRWICTKFCTWRLWRRQS